MKAETMNKIDAELGSDHKVAPYTSITDEDIYALFNAIKSYVKREIEEVLSKKETTND